MKKKVLSIVLVLALVLSMTFAFTACGEKTEENRMVRVSSTTSVNGSGLMEYLQPYFQLDNPGYDWKISSQGTGAAIESAQQGNADAILVHSKTREDAFVEAGYGRTVAGYADERVSFMENFFVIVGPTADSAGVATAENATAAFDNIAADKTTPFISRGDASGTHTKELALWKAAGVEYITEDGAPKTEEWYVSAGLAMPDCLFMASEQSGYVLTDKATFLSLKNNPEGDLLPNVEILLDETTDMVNVYSMIAVNPDAPEFGDSVDIDTVAADVFIKWMTGDAARGLISQYGTSNFGENLFTLKDGYLAA